MVTKLEGVSRAWRRPRAWGLVYALVTLPASLTGLLMALFFLPLARQPIFLQALTQRRLDPLAELFVGQIIASTFGTPHPEEWVIALGEGMVVACGALLVWPLLGLAWVWLEGGTLASYASAEPLSWDEFWRACKHWFGPFVLVNSVGLLLVGLIWLGFSGVAWFLSERLPFTALALRALGGLLAGALGSWVELMRVAAVVSGTRRVSEMARGAWLTLTRHTWTVLALLLGALLLYGGFELAYRAAMKTLPWSWWWAVLLLQQAYITMRLGVRLGREAGLVACMQR